MGRKETASSTRRTTGFTRCFRRIGAAPAASGPADGRGAPSARRGAIRLSLLTAAFALALVAVPASAGASYSFLEIFGSAAEPTFTAPAGVTIDPATGDVLVIDGQTVKRFKPNGEPDPFSALAGSNVIDGAGGADATPQGEILSNPGYPSYEVQVAVAPPSAGGGTAGNIYVTDPENGVVDVFDSTGTYLQQLSFNFPCGVAVDSGGHVFVGDYAESAVYKLAPALNGSPPPTTTYTQTGEFASTQPCIVAAGAGPTAGFIFVTQYEGPVTKVDSEGAEEGVTKYVVDSGANSSVAVDPVSGRVYTIETELSAEVQVYDASGASAAVEVDSFEATGLEAYGIGVDGSGKAYVTTESGHVEVFSEPATEFNLTINQTGTGTGEVECEIDGGGLGTCPATVEEGKTVKVVATEDAGSELAALTGTGSAAGNCNAGTGICEFSITADSAVTAEFNLTKFNLKVVKAGTGTGKVTSSPAGIDCGATCEHEFSEGTVVTLTATPEGGSSFAGWSGAGCTGTGTCQVTLSAAKEVTATFTAPKFKLKVVKAGTGTGKVTSSPAGIDCGATCEHEFSEGTVVTLTATPEGGSSFAGWSGAGCTGTGTCQVTMTAAKEVTATFTAPVTPPPSCATDPSLCPPPPSCATNPSLCPPSTATLPATAKVKAGKAQIKLTCPGPGACSGVLKLSAKIGGKKKVIGKTSFSLAGGASVMLKVKLSSAALKVLKKKKTLQATASGTGLKSRTIKLKL